MNEQRSKIVVADLLFTKDLGVQIFEFNRMIIHPGTRLKFPTSSPISILAPKTFHNRVRDGSAWFHISIEHLGMSESNSDLIVIFYKF